MNWSGVKYSYLYPRFRSGRGAEASTAPPRTQSPARRHLLGTRRGSRAAAEASAMFPKSPIHSLLLPPLRPRFPPCGRAAPLSFPRSLVAPLLDPTASRPLRRQSSPSATSRRRGRGRGRRRWASGLENPQPRLSLHPSPCPSCGLEIGRAGRSTQPDAARRRSSRAQARAAATTRDYTAARAARMAAAGTSDPGHGHGMSETNPP